jgi:hypothetical protein
MGGKFSQKLQVFISWVFLNRNFLKENRQYTHAGWEISRLKYVPNCFWDSVVQVQEAIFASPFQGQKV